MKPRDASRPGDAHDVAEVGRCIDAAIEGQRMLVRDARVVLSVGVEQRVRAAQPRERRVGQRADLAEARRRGLESGGA